MRNPGGEDGRAVMAGWRVWADVEEADGTIKAYYESTIIFNQFSTNEERTVFATNNTWDN